MKMLCVVFLIFLFVNIKKFRITEQPHFKRIEIGNIMYTANSRYLEL